ncbi:MAG: hypothetical protein WCC81_20110 [Pseudolabrys sp.]
MHDGGAVDALKRIALKIVNDLSHAINAARAYGVKKLCGELREHCANAAARYDLCSGASEKIRELPHAVEIRLQPCQKNNVVFLRVVWIERAMPVFMVQTHVEMFGIDQGRDMKTGYRLHDVFRTALDAARPKVRADDKSLSFLGAVGAVAIGRQRLASHE